MGDAMDVDGGGTMEVDMGYETHTLRGEDSGGFRSRRLDEERQRRASIKAILADESITPHERRRSIQYLMDGRRSSIGTASVASSSGSSAVVVGDDANPYGYDDSDEYGYGDDNGPNPGAQQSMYSEDGPVAFLYEGDHSTPVSNEYTKRAELTRPHCEHYDRKCTLVAPCCGAAFGCRLCHDDSPVLPPRLMMKKASRRYPRSSSLPGSFTTGDQTPEETHHPIDRFAIKEVICRECYTKQSSKT
jgi:CHY zinc finger